MSTECVLTYQRLLKHKMTFRVNKERDRLEYVYNGRWALFYPRKSMYIGPAETLLMDYWIL